jgi:hypothetical protein
MPNRSNLLPEAFRDLEPLCAVWALPSINERVNARLSHSLIELQSVYEALISRADKAMEYLDERDLDALAPEDSRLLMLMLSLAHVSISVEIQGGVWPPNTSAPYPVEMLGGFSVLG